MPFMLRKIRQARWYKVEGAWLAADEIPADPLSDLTTKDNQLSVWYIEDDRLNLERVIAALAASGTDVANVDYALLDHRLLSDMHIKIDSTRGGTPDEEVNTSWHRDLVELSAGKLVTLAIAIFTHAEKQRMPKIRVHQLIAHAVTPGSPIFKAVQQKRYKALYRALKESPTAPESAVAAGSERSHIERSVGAP